MPASRQRELVASGPKAVIAAAKKSGKRPKRAAHSTVAAATNYKPETEHERDLKILRKLLGSNVPISQTRISRRRGR